MTAARNIFSPRQPAVLLVHGAWHGGWCWAGARAELDRLGVSSLAVDLPSADPTRLSPAGMQDDAEAVRQLLAVIDGPVLLVAHSYGGIPATQAAASASNVMRLVYVAAFRLPTGQSLRSFSGMPESSDALLPVPEDPIRLFYNDVAPDQARLLASRLVPQSSRAFSDALTRGVEEIADASYVICERDQVLPPNLQQQMAAGIPSTRMSTGHSPFIVDPAGFAAQLIAEISAITHPDHAL